MVINGVLIGWEGKKERYRLQVERFVKEYQKVYFYNRFKLVL